MIRKLGRLLPALALLAATAAMAQDVSVHEGDLDASSPRDGEGRPYAEWDLWLEAGERIRVRAEAAREDLDPLIEIYRRDANRGLPLSRDDDSGGYPDALLDFRAPRGDAYAIRVVSYHERGGRYTLRIEHLARPSLPALEAVNPGRFDNSAARDAGGAHYRDHSIELAAGQQVLLRLDAADFDALLRVYPAGGETGAPVATDDDGGEGLNSMLLFRAPRAGRYTVRATQLSHGDGPWTLRMNAVE